MSIFATIQLAPAFYSVLWLNILRILYPVFSYGLRLKPSPAIKQKRRKAQWNLRRSGRSEADDIGFWVHIYMIVILYWNNGDIVKISIG